MFPGEALFEWLVGEGFEEEEEDDQGDTICKRPVKVISPVRIKKGGEK